MTTTSFLRDLIGWDVNIRMRWFFFSKANFTFFAFPVSSKCNRAKGCASSPMDVTSVVALQFREARPVSVISLWEAWSLEAKPSESSCFEKNTTWKQFLKQLNQLYNSFYLCHCFFRLGDPLERPLQKWFIEPHEAVPEVSKGKVYINLKKNVPKEIDCDLLNTFIVISHATLFWWWLERRTKKVLQSTTPYYKVLLRYYSVLQSTIPHYSVLQSTTPYYIQSLSKF